MNLKTEDVRAWLEQKYADFRPEAVPMRGTYGLIWFLNAKHSSMYPRSFAVKTLDPERLVDSRRAADLLYMRREFRMWVALPHTYNVVPALGIDEAIIASHTSDEAIRLPLVRMPRLSGSLDAWIGVPDPSPEDRLIALAQGFNGLLWLYDHGFEGHGDLKPSNILFSNLSDRSTLKDGGPWPSRAHPWLIRVADLGWADAWVDLGFVNKALRRYLAPERLGDGGRVVPQQSDIFSMGVIASELLQGRHPAPNVKRVEQSEGGCRKWAQSGQRVLDGISSRRVRHFLEACLSPEPSDRPTTKECISAICEELRCTYDHDIEATLALWRTSTAGDVAAEHEHAAWAAGETLVLGSVEIRHSQDDLERRLEQIDVCDLGTCESWATLASGLVVLLQKEDPTSSRIAGLRDRAAGFLRVVLGPIDREVLDTAPPSGQVLWPTPFERLAGIVHQMAEIASIRYDTPESKRLGLGQLTLSAWAFATASSVREHFQDDAAIEQYLAQAIELATDEAVPYYFRAFWSHAQWIVLSALEPADRRAPSANQLERWIDDLQAAIRLRPSWEEPQRRLASIRTLHSSALQ